MRLQAGDAATDTHVCQNADTRETGPDQHHQLAMADHGILNSRPAPAKKKAAGYAQYGGSAAGIQSLIESEPDHNVRQKIGAYISVARKKRRSGSTILQQIANIIKRLSKSTQEERASAWETHAAKLYSGIDDTNKIISREYTVLRNRTYLNFVREYLRIHVSVDEARTYYERCTKGGGRHRDLKNLDAAIFKAYGETFQLSEEDKEGYWRSTRMTLSTFLKEFLEKSAAADARRPLATDLDFLAAAASHIFESEVASDQPENTRHGTLIASSSALEGGCAGASQSADWTEFIALEVAPPVG